MSVDARTESFGASFEVDFKFKVNEISKAAGLAFFNLTTDDQDQEIRPEQIKVPFIILNCLSREIARENHYFKVSNGDADSRICEPPVSMYGSPEQVTMKTRLDAECWKCEKYFITGSFKYHAKELLYPFGDALFILKFATDGRPGSENLDMIPHNGDCSYPAFSHTMCGLQPHMRMSDDGQKYVPAVHYDHLQITQPGYEGSYPRCYVLLAASGASVSLWLKFYVLPAMVCYLSFTYEFADQDNFVSVSGTNVLAFIALLFTLPDASVMSFAEQSILLFCAMQMGAGIYFAFHGYVHEVLESVVVCCLVVLTVAHSMIAWRANKIVSDAVENNKLREVFPDL